MFTVKFAAESSTSFYQIYLMATPLLDTATQVDFIDELPTVLRALKNDGSGGHEAYLDIKYEFLIEEDETVAQSPEFSPWPSSHSSDEV
jgi:hypothetical protein